jgi:transcriptional regulator GlxA family with amidase domain
LIPLLSLKTPYLYCVSQYKGPRLSHRYKGTLSKESQLTYAQNMETAEKDPEVHGLKERRSQRRALVSEATQLMQKNLADNDLRLEQVAEELKVSTRHLQRAFKEFHSPGFRHELARLRVREAARLMELKPERRIADISQEVGYPHPMHFAKAFKRHLGVSPREWRKAQRKS